MPLLWAPSSTQCHSPMASPASPTPQGGLFPVPLAQTRSTAVGPVAEPSWRQGHRGDSLRSHQIMALPSLPGFIFHFFCCISLSPAVSAKVDTHSSIGNSRVARKQLNLLISFLFYQVEPPWKNSTVTNQSNALWRAEHGQVSASLYRLWVGASSMGKT